MGMRFLGMMGMGMMGMIGIRVWVPNLGSTVVPSVVFVRPKNGTFLKLHNGTLFAVLFIFFDMFFDFVGFQIPRFPGTQISRSPEIWHGPSPAQARPRPDFWEPGNMRTWKSRNLESPRNQKNTDSQNW